MAIPGLPPNLAARYEVKEILAQGAMSVLYRASDSSAGGDVALKILLCVSDPASLELFRQEYSVLSSLHHSNIIEILDLGELDEEGKRQPYFVMPFLAGTTLEKLIRTASHRLTVGRTVDIICQACQGLQVLHERGLVHGGLKPGNIFVTDDDSVKLIDFGIDRFSSVRRSAGQPPDLLYLSPEQVGQTPPTPRSDIFSLSVVCYESLTGRQPFRRIREEQIANAILRQTPPLASELNSGVDQAVSRVVEKAMAKPPGGRYSTAQEFGDALSKALPNKVVASAERRPSEPAKAGNKASIEAEIAAPLRSGGDLSAPELVKRAETDFPVADWPDRKVRADQGNRTTQAMQLASEGQILCSRNQFVEGLELLRRASQLDPSNEAPRAALSDALVEQARRILDQDWKAAGNLIREALEVNPAHATAKSMRAQVLKRRRQQLLDEAVSRAKQLRAAGDLKSALATIDEGLTAFPGEKTLLEMRERLQKESDALQQKRQQDMEELRRLDFGSPKPVPPAKQSNQKNAPLPPDDRARGPQLQPPSNRAAADDKSGIGGPSRSEKGVPSPAAATRLFSPAGTLPTSLGSPSPTSWDETHRSATAPTTPVPQTEKQSSSPSAISQFLGALKKTVSIFPFPKANSSGPASESRPWLSRKVLIAGSVSLVFWALVLVVVLKFLHRPQASPAVVTVPVSIHTTPSGATIRINGESRGTSDLSLNLPAGTYQVDAQLDGYQAAAASLEAKPTAENSINLTLQPMLAAIRISSDTGTGKLWLDDQSPAELEGGQWTADNLAPGDHKLKFAGPQSQMSFVVEVQPGSPPVVKGKLLASGAHGLVVTSSGARVRVLCSSSPAKLSVDGQPEIDIGDGVDVPGVFLGTHQLALRLGGNQHTVDLEVGAGSSITAFLLSDQDIGTVLVVTGEDNTQVYLNGKLQKHMTGGGQLRIANLPPKDYTVRVVKPGFQDVPEQHVTIRKGEQQRLAFKLVPIPHLASFLVQNGTPGTQVLIDQQPVGMVQSDGTFHWPTVAPGDHIIELRKDQFQSKSFKRHFADGASVTLGPEAVLEAAMSQIRIVFSPPEAAVSVTRGNESPAKVTSGVPLTLQPGHYELTAKVGNFSRSAGLEVTAGESRTIGPLSLAPGGMQDFEDPSSWKPSNNWLAHKGGNFVLFKTLPTTGTFTFSAILQKGHRLQWVFNHLDDKNYELFQVDENFFYRSAVRNGEVTEEAKVPSKSEKKKPRTFRVVVTPSRIAHQIQQGESWVDLDTWNGANLSAGNFGFYIPGNDEIGLSNFSFYPDLRLK
jgi:serine/threonine protein kinase